MPKKPNTKENKCPRPKECLDESMLPGEANDKMLKKEGYLRDFDIRVKEYIKGMETQMRKILAELNRLGSTEKLKIDKDIRTMLVKDFIEKGGDLETLDFKELSTSIADVSHTSIVDEATISSQAQYMEASNSTVVTAAKGPGKRKMLRAKRPLDSQAPDSSLARHAIKNSRMRKDFTTPLVGNQRGKQQQLVTPMITPKFDVSKPLTAAREPIHGETLVSLRGSPVVKAQPDQPGDDSNLVSISLLAQQTVLGGRLFLDEGMSPNTLLQRKEVIEEAVHAINSRLEELNSQITAGSNLFE